MLGYLHNQGETKIARLLELTYQFFRLAADLNMTFLYWHIPGKRNVLTDQLSRGDQIILTGWTMSAQVLE